MVHLAYPVAVSVIGLGVALLAFFAFRRSPLIASAAFFAVALAESVFQAGLPPLVIGPLNVGVQDLLAAAAIPAALVRIAESRAFSRRILLLPVALGALWLVSLFRGVSLFGVESAVNQSRSYLYYLAAMFTGLSFPFPRKVLQPLLYLLGVTAWLLVGICLVRWGLVAMNLASSVDWLASSGMMIRVILAPSALLLLQAVVFAWVLRYSPGMMPLQRWLPLVAVPMLILLQHRTVWIALVAAFVGWGLLDRRWRPVAVMGGLGLAIAGVSALVVLRNAPLVSELIASAQNMSTFNWRIAGWQVLLSPDRFQSTIDYIIGQPLGTGYLRDLYGKGNLLPYNPHNFYLQSLLNIGALGLLSLVLLYARPLWKSPRRAADPAALAFYLVLVTQAVYFFAYPPGVEQGLWIGLGSVLLLGREEPTGHHA